MTDDGREVDECEGEKEVAKDKHAMLWGGQ
jgi:hypothetical protein